jgi:hypothetical protein
MDDTSDHTDRRNMLKRGAAMFATWGLAPAIPRFTFHRQAHSHLSQKENPQ